MEQFDALTNRLERLLEERKQLLHENQSLRLQISKLAQERAVLIDKNKLATGKIKDIITQLREEMA